MVRRALSGDAVRASAMVVTCAALLALAPLLVCVCACGPGEAIHAPVDGAATDAPGDARASASDAFTEAATPDDALASDGASMTSDGGSSGTPESGQPDGATSFDLGAAFSLSQNPNGVWRYGYTPGATLAVDPLALDTFTVRAALDDDAGGVAGLDPIAFWHPSDPATNGNGYYPYVAENGGTVSASEEASWALRPQEVAIEGSNSGQYGVVEFVAPRAGTYQVHAHFEGIHFRLSTTDVHVVAGGAGVFAANIDGYGGDPAFHAVEGANPTADFDGALSLVAGEVVAFAIGYGTNGTNYNDTTGLTVHIVLEGD